MSRTPAPTRPRPYDGKLRLLDDRPILDKGDDAFNHYLTAETLKAIVDESSRHASPVNIALFGKWGSGKTGVVEMMRLMIDAERKHKMVIFDVWRHASDSLRSQFLLFMDGKDGLDTGVGIAEAMDRTVTISTERPTLSVWNLVVFAATWILAFLLSNWGKQPALVSLTTSSLYAFIVLLVQLMGQTAGTGIITVDSRATALHRVDQPHQFDQKYTEILEKYRRHGNERRQVVVVFDNLDRCPDSIVCDALSMMKTYLERKHCVNVVACNEEGVIDHLTGSRSELCVQAEEYLRKYFHVSVRMPQMQPKDMRDYVHGLAESVGLPKEVEEITAIALIDNPRHTKTFLNAILVQRDNGWRRENAGLLEPGFVSGNLAYLAKLEAIRVRWPKSYEQLLLDPRALRQIEDDATNDSPTEAPPCLRVGELAKELPELRRFLRATSSVRVDDIVPFLRFARPDYYASQDDASAFLDDISIRMDTERTIHGLNDTAIGVPRATAISARLDELIDCGYSKLAANTTCTLTTAWPALVDSIRPHVAHIIARAVDSQDVFSSAWEWDTDNLLEALSVAGDGKAMKAMSRLAERIRDTSSTPPSAAQRVTVLRFLLRFWGQLGTKLPETYAQIRAFLSDQSKMPLRDTVNPMLVALAECNIETKASLVDDNTLVHLVEWLADDGHQGKPEIKKVLLGLADVAQDQAKYAAMDWFSNGVHSASSRYPVASDRHRYTFDEDALEVLNALGPPSQLRESDRTFLDKVLCVFETADQSSAGSLAAIYGEFSVGDAKEKDAEFQRIFAARCEQDGWSILDSLLSRYGASPNRAGSTLRENVAANAADCIQDAQHGAAVARFLCADETNTSVFLGRLAKLRPTLALQLWRLESHVPNRELVEAELQRSIPSLIPQLLTSFLAELAPSVENVAPTTAEAATRAAAHCLLDTDADITTQMRERAADFLRIVRPQLTNAAASFIAGQLANCIVTSVPSELASSKTTQRPTLVLQVFPDYGDTLPSDVLRLTADALLRLVTAKMEDTQVRQTACKALSAVGSRLERNWRQQAAKALREAANPATGSLQAILNEVANKL